MPVTQDQAMTADTFHYGDCVRTHGPRGGVTEEIVTWRRNGETKLWKTRPQDFRVPIKYGLRRGWYLTPDNARDFHTAEDCPLKDE
jgi:hypothetical protein